MTELKGLKWQVFVVDNPQRNAFVLPGGKIFVFTGILPIVQDEDGLAAVLGHEVGHSHYSLIIDCSSSRATFL